MMSETFISTPFTLFGTPFSKVMVTYSASSGASSGVHAQYQQMFVVGLVCRIFQLQTLMADVPEVTVAAVAVDLRSKGRSNAVSLAVFDFVFTGIHGPHIGHTPGSNDLEIRSQSFDAELETDLVVALSGSAVADCGSALFAGNLNQLLWRSAGRAMEVPSRYLFS